MENKGKELFEWVKSSELKEINRPICIRYDGGGAYHYTTVCSMEELQKEVTVMNPIEEIEFLKPVKIEQQGNIINDAIDFAEWIEKNIYTKGLNGKWYKIPGVLKGQQSQFTTVELYKLFKQPLP